MRLFCFNYGACNCFCCSLTKHTHTHTHTYTHTSTHMYIHRLPHLLSVLRIVYVARCLSCCMCCSINKCCGTHVACACSIAKRSQCAPAATPTAVNRPNIWACQRHQLKQQSEKKKIKKLRTKLFKNHESVNFSSNLSFFSFSFVYEFASVLTRECQQKKKLVLFTHFFSFFLARLSFFLGGEGDFECVASSNCGTFRRALAHDAYFFFF